MSGSTWLNGQWAAAIAGTLANSGVRHVVVCPGSRSSPLALAFAANPRLKVWPVIDERSAAFFALGLAKGQGGPAAVLCTSGSAGAHFLPAVMEAAHGGTPLIALTADRPWELQGFGAPQTTDQARLFERFARVELLPAPDAEAIPHLRAVVSRALATGGPVHFNVPFREPLAPDGAIPIDDALATRTVPPIALPELARVPRTAERGLIVCGPRDADDGFGEAVHRLGAALGFPVIAEAASNARFGFPDAIAHAELLVRDERLPKPQLVLRFGGGLTSKSVQGWLDTCGARTFVFSERGECVDPAHRAEAVIVGDAVVACDGLMVGRQPGAPTAYRALFRRADAAARQATSEAPFGEPSIARTVAAAARDNLFLSSSMPIRDVDAFAPPGDQKLRVFANRGLNGIDGIASTAAGVVAATGKRTVLLIGDLALLHDQHGLLIARAHRLPLTVVVVNNDGGGIFSFLPIAAHAEHFEQLFGTPHGLDLAHLAAFCGARFERPGSLAQLRAALDRPGFALIEVQTDRAANVTGHRALQVRVRESSWR